MLDIDRIVKLSLELDGAAKKYGYEVAEHGGLILVPVIGRDGGLTDRFLLEIRPTTQQQ